MLTVSIYQFSITYDSLIIWCTRMYKSSSPKN